MLTTRAAPVDYRAYLEEVTPRWCWDWPHQLFMYPFLEDVARGVIDRLMFKLPPRHSKTETVTVRFGPFCMEAREKMGQRLDVIQVSYSWGLAKKVSRRARNIARARTGLGESRSVQQWETAAGSSYMGVGIGGSVTGSGAGLLLLDDLVKNRKEAESLAYRDMVWQSLTDDLLTRLEPGGAVVMCQTPWHYDDAMGRLEKEQGRKEEGGEWTIVHLPALAEEGDPMGRQEGAALCPERYDVKALHRIRDAIGETSFSALYQGRPTMRGGNIIKTDWIGRYTQLPEDYLFRIISVDTGTKPKEVNDPTVATVWLVTRLGWFLEFEWRKRVQYPDLRKMVELLFGRFEQVREVLIEDQGNGAALIQDLKRHTAIPVCAVQPLSDKLTRLMVQSVHYETGKVKHPTKELAPWIAAFESELTTIPMAPHDDRGDSTSQALARINHLTQGSAFTVDTVPADTAALMAGLSDPGMRFGSLTRG